MSDFGLGFIGGIVVGLCAATALAAVAFYAVQGAMLRRTKAERDRALQRAAELAANDYAPMRTRARGPSNGRL